MNWHEFLSALLAFLNRHSEACLLLGGSLVTAGSRHMPVNFPSTVDAWWQWFRGTIQEVSNQRGGTAPAPQGTSETIPPPTDKPIRNPFKPASAVPQPEPPKES